MASMLSSLLTNGSAAWTVSGDSGGKSRHGNGVSFSASRMINQCEPKNGGTGPPLPDSTVRFGRVPKREKAKILAAMQKVNADVQERALSVELEDEAKLMTAIMRAHDETCDYTKEKVIPLLERARTQPVFTHCPSQLACPLNPPPQCTENGSTRIVEDFSERFWPAIRGVVEFAKRIPGFSLLAQDDQVTLLKAGVFEVLLVRLACMFDHRSNAMICLNGQVLRREAIHAASNARFLLDSMFDFSERLNALRLSDHELGLFSAVVVIAPDRPGIRNLELVHKIQKKLSEVLQKAITINHPENPSLFDDLMKKIPDLRTLNTLHSEKLLAYKMEPHIKDNNNANGCPGHDSEAASSPEVASTSVPHSPVANGGPSYADLISDPWVQYTMRTSPPAQNRVGEEDRSDSPGQLSQHNGSTTGSEWSTTDSKDRPERFGSPRSVGSSVSVDDDKSHVRANSFSSTRSFDEGVCSNDAGHHPPAHHATNHLTQHHPILQQHLQQTQPLYAQHHQISQFGKRPRDALVDHSSSDESFAIESPIKAGAYHKIRRVDSPTDSGIESGKEHGGPMSTPTASVCSSPHSSMEEKVKDVSDSEGGDKQDIDDMPVLKRALQAPPLINTTMLMDEAYRHHKKFRAARKESDSPSSQICPSKASLASAHSTLVKTLEQAPRYMNEQQLKRTDFIHNIIMRNESIPAHCAAAMAASRQGAKSPQQQQQQQQQQQHVMVSCANTEMNGNYAAYQRTVVTAGSQGNKMVVCPPGYYIPAGNAQQMTNNSNPTNNNNTPTSWSFLPGPQGTCPYTGATATSNSSSVAVTMARSPVMTVMAPSSGGSNSPAPGSTQNAMSPPPAMNGQRLVVFDPRGNSAANCATLVSPRGSPAPVSSVDNRMRQQNGGAPSPNAMSPPATNGDSQPLNLSKRMSQPTAVKMES